MKCDHWEKVVAIYYQCPCCKVMTDMILLPINGLYKYEVWMCSDCNYQCELIKLYRTDCKMRISMGLSKENK